MEPEIGKPSLIVHLLWPDVETEKGRSLAIVYGTLALGMVILYILIDILLQIYPDTGPGDGSAPLTRRIIEVVVGLMIAAAFGALAKRLWRKQSLTVARIGFVYLTVELAYNLRPESSSELALELLALLLSIHGVRGAEAARRHLARLEGQRRLDRQHAARRMITELG